LLKLLQGVIKNFAPKELRICFDVNWFPHYLFSTCVEQMHFPANPVAENRSLSSRRIDARKANDGGCLGSLADCSIFNREGVRVDSQQLSLPHLCWMASVRTSWLSTAQNFLLKIAENP